MSFIHELIIVETLIITMLFFFVLISLFLYFVDQISSAQQNSSPRLEPNDHEVNDLLKWSSNLDSTLLDNHWPLEMSTEYLAQLIQRTKGST